MCSCRPMNCGAENTTRNNVDYPCERSKLLLLLTVVVVVRYFPPSNNNRRVCWFTAANSIRLLTYLERSLTLRASTSNQATRENQPATLIQSPLYCQLGLSSAQLNWTDLTELSSLRACLRVQLTRCVGGGTLMLINWPAEHKR